MREEAHGWKQRQSREQQVEEEISPQPPVRQDPGAQRHSAEGHYLYPVYTYWKLRKGGINTAPNDQC